jgi:hypothetical protein
MRRSDFTTRQSFRPGFDGSSLAVTKLKYDAPNDGMTDPISNEDGYLIGVQLGPVLEVSRRGMR